MFTFIQSMVLQGKRLLSYIPLVFWKLLIYALVSRILLTLIGYAAWRFFGQIDPHSYTGKWSFSQDPTSLIHPNAFLSAWGHWDSNWYLAIARHWYVYTDSIARLRFAFFPLFPFVTRSFALIFGDLYITGLLVNFVALVTASWFLYKFVEEQWDSKTAFRAAKYLLIFPTSFYLSSYLSEPIFLMLSIVSIYYAYKNRWLTASIAAAIMIFSRPVGILILVPLVIRYALTHHSDTNLQKLKTISKLLVVPIIFGLFLYIEYLLTGEWFVFLRLENQGWHRVVSNPIGVVNAAMANFTNKFLLFSGALAVVLSTYLLRWRHAIPLVVWSVVVMIPALITELPGMPRYATVVFPMYIAIALMTCKRSVDDLVMITCSLGLGVLMLLWSINAPFLQ